jgi:hypothetical protein
MPKPPIEKTTTAPGTPKVSRGFPSSEILLPLLVEATTNIGTVAPLLLPCRVLAYRDALPPGLVGAYVTLFGGHESVHVGVLSDDTSCVAIARRSPLARAALDAVGVRTVMCNVARTLGDGLRRRLWTTLHVSVSEPVFVDGIARRTHGLSLRAAEVVLGGARATLVLAQQGDRPTSTRHESTRSSA